MRPHTTPAVWPKWLLTVLFFLAAVAPPGGIGVCLGEDGHVEVGSADSGCPCPGDEPAAPAEHDEDDHPDCNDLTLDSQIGQSPNELDSCWERGPIGESFVAVLCHTDAGFSRWAHRANLSRDAGPPRRWPRRLLEQRTVVLLA